MIKKQHPVSFLQVATLAAFALTARHSHLPFAVDVARSTSGTHGVQEVFCINLDQRPECWDFMREQFRELQLAATRWAAVDGQELDLALLAEIGLVNPAALKRYFLPDESKLVGIDLTAGSMGRALSHMQVWKHVIMKYGQTEDDRAVLVVENDCKFLANFRTRLDSALSQVPADWQIVFLGGEDLMQQQGRLDVTEGIRRLYHGFRETTAYLVTVNGCKACLEVTVPLSWQIDTHLTENEVQYDGAPAYTTKPLGYCCYPPLVRRQKRKVTTTDVKKQEHS
ncbi:CERCAM [Symbiodinium pilosum]|uniref:CERCAM protein n=1 Tax=Symbiodinium pilosum TaxID=2952 RepID=A0A812WVW3_SYMPI|nr:CERCAM [Symbiodinium pilosum]